jgi:phosphatidate cytidylyltransferase
MIRPELAYRFITGISLVACLGLTLLCSHAWPTSLFLVLITLVILIDEWPRFKAPWLTPFYPIFPLGLLILLNHSRDRLIIPVLFIATWSYDTGAYIIGTLVGRTKLCPSVSPSKTWEGALGGFMVSLGITGFFVAQGQSPVRFFSLIIFCFITVVAATGGDLVESYLKRKAGIKDAGSLLPGHGGFLDRFDSILGVVVVLYPLRKFITTMLS